MTATLKKSKQVETDTVNNQTNNPRKSPWFAGEVDHGQFIIERSDEDLNWFGLGFHKGRLVQFRNANGGQVRYIGLRESVELFAEIEANAELVDGTYTREAMCRWLWMVAQQMK